jgi:hypothetical protein
MQPKPYINYGFLPRLGIVFLSMSFMTANGIKLILGTFFFFLRHLSGQLLKIQKIYIIEILSAISTLSLIIAILPSHSYAKY